jgi:Uma2 family endonuclease
MGTLPVARLSEQDYLAIERAAEFRSEFVGGEMFAMSGGTARHSRLAGRILSQLDQQLEESHCAPFTSDLRIRTPRGDQFYPDVSVVCSPFETHEGNKDVCANPVVIVEVLSPSTANYDRGLKFVLYRDIPSLRNYLIFHSDGIHVEHYSRQSNDSWLLQHHHGGEARIVLPSIRCELTLGSIYAGAMEWPG